MKINGPLASIMDVVGVAVSQLGAMNSHRPRQVLIDICQLWQYEQYGYVLLAGEHNVSAELTPVSLNRCIASIVACIRKPFRSIQMARPILWFPITMQGPVSSLSKIAFRPTNISNSLISAVTPISILTLPQLIRTCV
jgi:hypothetical protein